MLTTTTDAGLYLDVSDTFGECTGTWERQLDRVRHQGADFVVLNFHGTDDVPTECLEFVGSLLEDDPDGVRIVLTETSYEIRRSFAAHRMLAPAALGEPGESTTAIALRRP